MRESPLLSIRDLRVHFKTEEGTVEAVNGVDLDLMPGEAFGLVGESGSGKSVTAYAIMRLIKAPAGRIVEGSIHFRGRDLLSLSRGDMRRVRGNEITMIFQEPMTSLNPVWPIGWQIREVLRIHRGLNRKDAEDETVRQLERVGFPSPRQRLLAFPHQLSGGMRQRVMIAMAMACQPQLLLADEPTTALDVTIQAQILDLIRELQEETGMAVLMITHDFGVISEITSRMAVMYAGRVVEQADVASIGTHRHHPYTRGLLKSVPAMGDKIKFGRRRLYEIPGVVPRMIDRRPGCAFAPRCGLVHEVCRRRAPTFGDREDGLDIACFAELEEGRP